MKTNFHFRYNLLMTTLMCIFTASKIYYLYEYTIAPANTVGAYIRTALFLLMFYVSFNYIIFRKSFAPRLIIHELLGAMILADIMYFNYFSTFPSVAEVQKIGLLSAVWTSITALFKLRYLYIFADIFVLPVVHLGMKKYLNVPLPSRKRPAAAVVLLAVFLFLDSMSIKSSNSYQLFDNYGLLHFHIGQAIGILRQNGGENAGANLIRSMGSVAQADAPEPKYFGIAKDRNFIVIQVEALQSFVINRHYNDQELTPNLNKLIKQDSLYFDRYYQHIANGGTSDAEFASQLSLYPSFSGSAYSIYVDRYLYGLPRILKDEGYNTMAFHGFKPEFWNRSNMYPVMGFDSFTSSNDFTKDEIIGMGVSDKSFFMQTTEYLRKSEQPFYAFLVTLSSHHPYEVPNKYQQIKLEKAYQNTLLGSYLQTINYTDSALGAFLAELKKQGLYDNSIIAIYGDHNAISVSDKENYKLMSKLLGHDYKVDEMVNVPLIIHIPGLRNAKTISTAGGQMDFMPTLLNLLGINKSNIKFYGQDLCNAKEGFAAFQYVMPKGSFIDNEKVYLASSDGIFEHGKAWDYKTRKPIDLEQCRFGFNRAVHEIEECKYLLAKDLLRPAAPAAKIPESTKEKGLFAEFKQQVKLLVNQFLK